MAVTVERVGQQVPEVGECFHFRRVCVCVCLHGAKAPTVCAFGGSVCLSWVCVSVCMSVCVYSQCRERVQGVEGAQVHGGDLVVVEGEQTHGAQAYKATVTDTADTVTPQHPAHTHTHTHY